jgi:coenzyme F420-reducing hydrogenase delta subunit/Fe-S-cluster-containing hydrogenase component 2
MAGVSRLQYATDIRLVRVMCSGRVDLEFVLRAFSNGMDGIFIGGCRLNECNYITHGNYDALSMVLLCKKIMAHLKLNPERLRIKFMTSGEGNLFTEVVDEFTKNIKEIGPLGKGEEIDENELKSKLEEVRKLIPYIKIAKRKKLATRLENKDEYDGFFTSEEIDKLFSDVTSYYIDPDKCQACMICFRRCPVEAIEGGKNKIHVIDQDKCIKCGTCFEACPPRFGAVKEISGEPVPPPIAEEERTIARKSKKNERKPFADLPDAIPLSLTSINLCTCLRSNFEETYLSFQGKLKVGPPRHLRRPDRLPASFHCIAGSGRYRISVQNFFSQVSQDRIIFPVLFPLHSTSTLYIIGHIYSSESVDFQGVLISWETCSWKNRMCWMEKDFSLLMMNRTYWIF